EPVVWARLLIQGCDALPPAPCEHNRSQPTIASAFGLGRGWGGIWPFLLAAGAGVLLAARALPRLRISGQALAIGLGALVVWALFAALAPTLLGIDHQGLLSIVHAGDPTA